MISVIVATHNSAPLLVRCLAPLVSGVADGLVKECIVADAGSRDGTIEMAEEAGCTIVRAAEETRWRQGAAVAKGDWLLLLDARAMLEAGWIEEARRFTARGGARAATFSYAREDGPDLSEALVNARTSLFKAALRTQGLLISHAHYNALSANDDVIFAKARGHLAILRTRAVVV